MSEIFSRTTSGFPLSIGTSLAFESLFNPRLSPYDPAREIPNRVNVSDYDEIWINIFTLFRNIVGALEDQKDISKISVTDIVNTIESEIETINSLFSVEGGGLCTVNFYNYHYDVISKKLAVKSVLTREAKTDNQKIFSNKYSETIKALNKKTDSIINVYGSIQPKQKTKSLIITHVTYDLLSYENFSLLDLLESHTGKLKHRHSWNSKFHPVGENNLSMLPFLRVIYLVFGDKTLIKPSDYKLRTLILDIANRRKWTPMTTVAKVMQDFEFEIKEPYIYQFLKNL